MWTSSATIPPRHFGDRAQRIAVRAPSSLTMMTIPGVRIIERGAADAALGHRRRGRRQGPGRAVGEADRRDPAALGQDHRLLPVGKADADRRPVELAGPVALGEVDAHAEVAPAAAAVEPGQAVAQRLRGGVLHLRDHRRAHPQPAGVEAVRALVGRLAELLDQVAADLLHEIAALLAELLVAAVADGAERRGGRGPPLFLG